MIYKTEPESMYEPDIDSEESTVKELQSNGFYTAQSYLKGLHWNDRPTALMPKDAYLLSKARRFYESLSDTDRLVINSFSDPSIFETMNVKQRNTRFNKLCFMFMQETGYTLISTPKGEKKGSYNNGKLYQRKSD